MGGVWRAPLKSVEITLFVVSYTTLWHVSEKDDVLLTRSPISHSTTVVPSNRRNALTLNTINRHTLILIGGRGREEGVLVWGGDVYCAILIGVVLRDRACHTREELIQYTNSEVGRGTG
jgi:hypothetical protein